MTTLRNPKIESLNEACAYLAAFAKAHELGAVRLDVRADGRVEIAGVSSGVGWTSWTVRADTQLGSAEPTPSAALETRLTDAGRAALARSK